MQQGGGREVLCLEQERTDSVQRVRAGGVGDVAYACAEGFEVSCQLTELADLFVQVERGRGDGVAPGDDGSAASGGCLRSGGDRAGRYAGGGAWPRWG